MPLLTTTEPREKRHAPVWLLVPALAILLVVATFAWSCFTPIVLERSRHGIGFGYGPAAALELVTGSQRRTSGSLKELPEFWAVPLPPYTPGSGYLVWWY